MCIIQLCKPTTYELNIRKKNWSSICTPPTSYKEAKTRQIDWRFFPKPRRLRWDCNFKGRTSKQAGDEAVRDVFICGITSTVIRLRRLENKTLDLQTAYEQALRLDFAQKNNEAWVFPLIHPSQPLATEDYIATQHTVVVVTVEGERITKQPLLPQLTKNSTAP